MITDGKKWQHYFAARSLSALFRGISSNHNGSLSCFSCCHSYRTLNRFKEHEKLCNNNDCCHVDMPEEHNKISKYRHGEKSLLLVLTRKFYYQKHFFFKIILKNLTQEKKQSTYLQVGHGL